MFFHQFSFSSLFRATDQPPHLLPLFLCRLPPVLNPKSILALPIFLFFPGGSFPVHTRFHPPQLGRTSSQAVSPQSPISTDPTCTLNSSKPLSFRSKIHQNVTNPTSCPPTSQSIIKSGFFYWKLWFFRPYWIFQLVPAKECQGSAVVVLVSNICQMWRWNLHFRHTHYICKGLSFTL